MDFVQSHKTPQQNAKNRFSYLNLLWFWLGKGTWGIRNDGSLKIICFLASHTLWVFYSVQCHKAYCGFASEQDLEASETMEIESASEVKLAFKLELNSSWTKFNQSLTDFNAIFRSYCRKIVKSESLYQELNSSLTLSLTRVCKS
jgi:hypothetical protein